MRPESLPKSYQEFILKTGPVAEPVYKVVKECCRGGPVDLTALSAHLSNKRNPDLINLTTNPSIIPCSVIHPDRASCLAQNVNVVSSTFKKTFPLYFSLTFVPFVVLRLQKVIDYFISLSCLRFSYWYVLAIICVQLISLQHNYASSRNLPRHDYSYFVPLPFHRACITCLKYVTFNMLAPFFSCQWKYFPKC